MTDNAENSNKPPSKLRDFLYLDTPRVTSLYAQRFGSVTVNTINDYFIQKLTSDTDTIEDRSRASTRSEEGINSSRETVEGVLHDQMYVRLEESLSSVIQNVSGIEPEKLSEVLSSSFLIHADGIMEIEDFDNLRAFLSQFNTMGKAIAYSSLTKEQKNLIAEQQSKRRGNQRQGQKNIIDRNIEDFIASYAKAVGLHQDPKDLEHINHFLSTFGPSSYYISLASSPSSDVRFRGVCDTKLLRLEPWRIRSLYGSQSNQIWKMVGTVTFIPKTFQRWQYPEGANVGGMLDNEVPAMIDKAREMFRSARSFERMFLESTGVYEVIVSPLAIYREFDLNPSPTQGMKKLPE